MNQKITKEEIIKRAWVIFNQQGYHQTSMETLARACNLQRGSFYHYFSSKKALMQAALNYLLNQFRQEIIKIAYAEEVSPKKRLSLMLERQTAIVSCSWRGCFFGNTASADALNDPELQKIVRTFFEEWSEAFTYLYKYQYDTREAKKLALLSIAEIEGAILLMKLYQDKDYLIQICDNILARFQNQS